MTLERGLAVVRRLKREAPLIYLLANPVTAYGVASVTRALGALPVMGVAPEEVGDLARQARAVVVNLGVPTADRLRAAALALEAAAAAGIPAVLDPVGVGATEYRGQAASLLLIHRRVTVVRANPAEAQALLDLVAPGGEGPGEGSATGPDPPRQWRLVGVEAVPAGPEAGGDRPQAVLALELADRLGAAVAITGPRDWVSDGSRLVRIEHGDARLRAVVGAGCMASAVVGAFCAVEPDPLVAASLALACYGLAAERAAASSGGPGSLYAGLIDEVHRLAEPRRLAGARLKVSLWPTGAVTDPVAEEGEASTGED